MVDLFERTGADCLSRPQPLVPTQQGIVARAVAAARTSPFGHSVHSTIYDNSERMVSPTSAGAMYRRRVFERVGNFDTRFDACEDVELNYRCEQAELLCYTSPALAVQYETANDAFAGSTSKCIVTVWVARGFIASTDRRFGWNRSFR